MEIRIENINPYETTPKGWGEIPCGVFSTHEGPANLKWWARKSDTLCRVALGSAVAWFKISARPGQLLGFPNLAEDLAELAKVCGQEKMPLVA